MHQNLIGYDPTTGSWHFADCIYGPDGMPDFPPQDIAHQDHEVPRLYQDPNRSPIEQFLSIDFHEEQCFVAKQFIQLAADLIATFGDESGALALGTALSYAIAPELLEYYKAHPGLWLTGPAAAGKTVTAGLFMRMWGFSEKHHPIIYGGYTAAFLDHTLAHRSNLPVHLDDFHQDTDDKYLIPSLRAPFNRQSKQKGKLDQSKIIYALQPRTSLIVTGEGVTDDSATLSRYAVINLDPNRRIGSKPEQHERLLRMRAQASNHHRIIRWIMGSRNHFSNSAMHRLHAFLRDPKSLYNDPSHARHSYCHGVAFACFTTALSFHLETLLNQDTPADHGITHEDFQRVLTARDHLLEFTQRLIAKR